MIRLKMLVPTANTATAYQEVQGGTHILNPIISERWTLSGFIDHTESNILEEGWGFKLKVPATAGAGTGSLSALTYLLRQRSPTGGSANLVQLIWTDPILNAAVTATAFFERMGQYEWIDPYNFLVDVELKKYMGP